jgi:hypothetical protein
LIQGIRAALGVPGFFQWLDYSLRPDYDLRPAGHIKISNLEHLMIDLQGGHRRAGGEKPIGKGTIFELGKE